MRARPELGEKYKRLRSHRRKGLAPQGNREFVCGTVCAKCVGEPKVEQRSLPAEQDAGLTYCHSTGRPEKGCCSAIILLSDGPFALPRKEQ